MNNENGSIIYDVLTYVKHPKFGPYFLNIEAQKVRVSYPFSNRIDVYLSNGICMQNYGKMEETYKELKPFVSIWIFFDALKKYENTIKIDIQHEETFFGKKEKFNTNRATMKAIKIYLGKEINTENNCLALFGTLFSMKLSYEEKIKKLNEIDSEFLDEEIEKEVNTMCNLGEAYREEFLNEGRMLGHQEGRAEGLQEGREEGSTNMAFKAALSMVDKLHFDFKKALIILDITDPKEQEIYLKKYEDLKNN